MADRPEVAEVRPGEELDWAALERHLRQRAAAPPGRLLGAAVPERLGQPDLPRPVRRRTPSSSVALRSARSRPGPTTCSASTPCSRGLHAAYPRAPLGLHYCADTAVIGAHFLVSEYRPGVVVWDRVPDSAGGRPGARAPHRLRRGRRPGRPAPGRSRRLRPRLPRPPRRLPGPSGPRLAAPLGGGRDEGPRHRRPGGRAPGPAPARVRPARRWCTTTSRSTTASSPPATPTRSPRSSTGTWRRSATRSPTWGRC